MGGLQQRRRNALLLICLPSRPWSLQVLSWLPTSNQEVRLRQPLRRVPSVRLISRARTPIPAVLTRANGRHLRHRANPCKWQTPAPPC